MSIHIVMYTDTGYSQCVQTFVCYNKTHFLHWTAKFLIQLRLELRVVREIRGGIPQLETGREIHS